MITDPHTQLAALKHLKNGRDPGFVAGRVPHTVRAAYHQAHPGTTTSIGAAA